MRVNAYILAADPAWVEASVRSYYPFVDRIVVSYDETGTSWSGTPLDVGPCLHRLRRLESTRKFEFVGGSWFDPALTPMQCDTRQRSHAISLAGAGADWVLQLDTDEVLPAAAAFMAALERADRTGFAAVNYPSVWLHSWCGGKQFLASGGRGGRRRAYYPGAIAVRPQARLAFGRRPVEPCYHVDTSWRSSDASSKVVHEVVDWASCIHHLSFVRSTDELRRKHAAWSHSRDRDWNPILERWLLARRNPRLVSLLSQFAIGAGSSHFSPVTVPPPVTELLELSPQDLADMHEITPHARGSASAAAGLFRAYLWPGWRRARMAARKRLPAWL